MKVILGGFFYSHKQEVTAALIAGGLYGLFASVVGYGVCSLIGKDEITFQWKVSKKTIGFGVAAVALPILLCFESLIDQGSGRAVCEI